MKTHTSSVRFWTLAVATVTSLSVAAACTSTGTSTGTSSVSPSGTELWSQHCSRCHNIRSPSEFSDSEWDAVMLHMRIRADLTGGEARSILAFLKASN